MSEGSKAELAAHLEQKFLDFGLHRDPDGAVSSSMLRAMHLYTESWFVKEFPDVCFKSTEKCFLRCIQHEISSDDKQDPATWLEGVYAATSEA